MKHSKKNEAGQGQNIPFKVMSAVNPLPVGVSMRNVLHCFTHLNFGPQLVVLFGVVMKLSRHGALMEEVSHWGHF